MTWDVILTKIGDKREEIARIIRTATGRDATSVEADLDRVSRGEPLAIKSYVTRLLADRLKKDLERHGATAEARESRSAA